MITNNPMQLKAYIKKIAVEKKISAQQVMQNYMLERLLERISLSEYKYNFIFKGGFLISAIVGLDYRSTMDLDTTVKGFTLTKEKILGIFNEICKIKILDDIMFEVVKVVDIRETDDYPGLRVSLKANYYPISVPITVDITTGDVITPREIEFSYHLLFSDRTLNILAYNLETVLAEKIETVLSRNVASTRPRDFYDIYILYSLRKHECKKSVLLSALKKTAIKRNSLVYLIDYKEILQEIRSSKELKARWENYRLSYDYAKDISFEDSCNVIQLIMDGIEL